MIFLLIFFFRKLLKKMFWKIGNVFVSLSSKILLKCIFCNFLQNFTENIFFKTICFFGMLIYIVSVWEKNIRKSSFKRLFRRALMIRISLPKEHIVFRKEKKKQIFPKIAKSDFLISFFYRKITNASFQRFVWKIQEKKMELVCNVFYKIQ